MYSDMSERDLLKWQLDYTMPPIITDEDLKEVPKNTLLPDNDPNRENPIREWFVMTIKHQNMAWGEIHMIRRILESNT